MGGPDIGFDRVSFDLQFNSHFKEGYDKLWQCPPDAFAFEKEYNTMKNKLRDLILLYDVPQALQVELWDNVRTQVKKVERLRNIDLYAPLERSFRKVCSELLRSVAVIPLEPFRQQERLEEHTLRVLEESGLTRDDAKKVLSGLVGICKRMPFEEVNMNSLIDEAVASGNSNYSLLFDFLSKKGNNEMKNRAAKANHELNNSLSRPLARVFIIDPDHPPVKGPAKARPRRSLRATA